MLKPNCDIKEFEKMGFKKCRGLPSKLNCYYLCVARGCKMIFVSPIYYAINDWDDTDERIHKQPNCKYRDNRDALDITYDLIKKNMLIREGA